MGVGFYKKAVAGNYKKKLMQFLVWSLYISSYIDRLTDISHTQSHSTTPSVFKKKSNFLYLKLWF